MSSLAQTVALRASAAQTASATEAMQTAKFAPSEALLVLNVTAASGTTPTLDVYVDVSPDGGTSWINIGHFAQLTAAGKTFLALGATNQNTGGSFGVAGTDDCAVGTTRPIAVTDKIRTRSVITGTTPSFTYSVNAFLKN